MRNETSGARPGESPLIAKIVEEFVQHSSTDSAPELEFDLLKDLVQGFAGNPLLARRAMRELLSRTPMRFYSASLQVLRTSAGSPGHDYLISLLLENDLLSSALADPNAFPVQTAISLARKLSRMDPHLDARLIRRMFREDGTCDPGADPAVGQRILTIIDRVSDGVRLVPALMKLAKHHDRKIQSKATLLLARAHHNTEWFAAQLASADPRIRANAIEGLLKFGPSPRQLGLLWQASNDPHHRVATTALLALLKAGEEDAATRLQQICDNSTGPFRLAACWAMGESGDARFLDTLQRLAKTETGPVRSMALKGAVRLRKGVSGGTQ